MRRKGEKRDTRPEKGANDEEDDDLDAKLEAFVKFGIMPQPKKKLKATVGPKKLASIALTSRVKRPVPPVVVDGVTESPEMIRLYNEYARAVEAYPRKVHEAKVAILKELREAGIGREGRGDTMLRYECDVKGIDNTGVRLLLLERLAKHDRGEAVMTRTLKAPERIEGKQVVSTLVTHKVAPMRPRGEDGMLCLSHDVLRTLILPRVGGGDTLDRLGPILHPYIHAHGVHILFAVARTCKYLRDDALFVLNRLSRQVFLDGVAHHPGEAVEMTFTPLAYSCYLYYCGRFTREFCGDPTLYPTEFARLCSQLHVKKTKCASYLESDYKTRILGARGANWYLHRGYGHEAIRAIVIFAVRTWGSIEGVLRERDKASKRKELREQEKLSVFYRALERIKAANAAFSEAFGLPKILKEAQPREDETKYLDMTIAGHLLVTRAGRQWADKLRDHVIKERPITLKPVFKLLEGYLERIDGPSPSRLRGNTVKCIQWIVDALSKKAQYTDAMATRLSNMVEPYLRQVIEPTSTWTRAATPWKLLGCEGRALVDDTFVDKFIKWIVSDRPIVHTPDTFVTVPVAFGSWAAGGGSTTESYADYLMFIWEDFSFPPHTFACGRDTLASGEAYQMIVESRSVFRSVATKIRPLTEGWGINHNTKIIVKPPTLRGEAHCPSMGVFFISQ